MSSGFFSNTSTDGLDVSFFTGNSATAALLSSPFTGQLTQNGNAVSTTNRLPVDVAFPAAQPFPAGFRVTNADGQPIPVRIIASDIELGGGGGASGGETFDGIIKNTSLKPVPVQFVGTPLVAIDGSVGVTGSITLAGVNHASGAVPVTLASVPTHGVTVQGTASVAITGTPSVAIAGTVPVSIAAKVKIDDTTPINVNASLDLPDVQRVQVENPQTSVSITGTPTVNANVTFPSTQAVSGTVAVSTLPNVTLTNPFDGVLRLAGQAVSASNRLPVNVTFPSTQDITGTVTIANPVTNVTATIAGTPTVALASNSVVVSNPLKIDTSTPLSVTVTNPSSGGGSFDGNVTVLGGTINANVAFPSSQTINGSVSLTGTPTVAISGTVPVSGSVNATLTSNAVTATIAGTPTVNIGTLPNVTLANPFDGVLKLAGQAVSSSNRLPVDVAFPATQPVSIANTVTVTQSGTVTVQGSVTATIPGTVTVNTSTAVTLVDRSATIVSGGLAQALASADAARRGAWIQNNSTGDLWVSEVGTATIGGSSMRIPAGVAYEWPSHGIPVTALTIIGQTTGQAFAARTW